MKLSEAKNKYVFSTKIDLGDGDFVKLRELTVGEMEKLKKVNEEDWITELSKLFPSCIVDHSFSKDSDGGEGQKASGDEVYNELKNSGTLFLEIIAAWMESLPLSNRLKKEPK
jgi:hypothetical protein